MAKLIGTAGHIDHGKTTLIRALTGIDADRLPEEKARGMTIDIGFAHLDLPGHGRVSIVDVPGHEKFLRNMLVGALGIDVALLCVAADEGVMPQTREHFQILELLPVDSMVVALTRADLADEDTLGLVQEEVLDLLRGTRFASAPLIPVSAVKGSGIPELQSALTEALSRESGRRSGPWYLPIDRAFSVKGHGCVVTGTLAQGEVHVGDEAILEPGHSEVRVRAIHAHGEPQEASEEGKRTALNLSGVRLEDVHRGMVLGAPGALFETKVFDARMRWVYVPKHATRVRVSIGSEEAIGKVFLGEETEIAQFRLETPIACAMDQPLIVRLYSPPELLGGGRVAVPQARVRKRGEEARVVDAQDPSEAVLEAIGDGIQGTPTDEICRLLGKTPQMLGNLFEKLLESGQVVGFAGHWFQKPAFENAANLFLAQLTVLHEESPMLAYLPREKVASRAGLKWTGKPFDRIISHLANEGRLAANGTTIKASAFKVKLTPRQREFLDRALEALRKEPVNTPGIHDLARAVGAPPQAVEEIMKLGIQAGEVLMIGEGVYYTPDQLENLKKMIAEVTLGKPFAATAIRDALGTTRKYVIPVLEYFDAKGYTIRTGDTRVVK